VLFDDKKKYSAAEIHGIIIYELGDMICRLTTTEQPSPVQIFAH